MMPSSEFVSTTTSCGPLPDTFVPAFSDSVQVPVNPPPAPVVGPPVVAEPVVAEPVVVEPVVAEPVLVMAAPPVPSPPSPAPDVPTLPAPAPPVPAPVVFEEVPPVVDEPPVVCDTLLVVAIPLVGVPPVVDEPEETLSLAVRVPELAGSSLAVAPSSEQPEPPKATLTIPTHKLFLDRPLLMTTILRPCR